jgi:DNA-binding transcriptional ArsR family regulator
VIFECRELLRDQFFVAWLLHHMRGALIRNVERRPEKPDHIFAKPIRGRWRSRTDPICSEMEVDVGVEAADNAAVLGLALHYASRCAQILNQMVQYNPPRFGASFAALSDATRRGVLEQLGRADASITDLAEKFDMTLTGMKKHVGVLERAGLVITQKVGRVRTCKLGRRRLEEEAAWIERYRRLWDARFDELDKVVEEQKRKDKVDGRKKRE